VGRVRGTRGPNPGASRAEGPSWPTEPRQAGRDARVAELRVLLDHVMQVGDECRLPGLRLFFRVVDLPMRLSVRLKRCRRVLQRTAIGKSPPVPPRLGDYVHPSCSVRYGGSEKLQTLAAHLEILRERLVGAVPVSAWLPRQAAVGDGLGATATSDRMLRMATVGARCRAAGSKVKGNSRDGLQADRTLAWPVCALCTSGAPPSTSTVTAVSRQSSVSIIHWRRCSASWHYPVQTACSARSG